MPDLPIAALVLCEPCRTPTPLEDMARGPDGIPLQLCRRCAGLPPRPTPPPVDFCDSDWPPPRRRRYGPVADLPDINLYQEQS